MFDSYICARISSQMWEGNLRKLGAQKQMGRAGEYQGADQIDVFASLRFYRGVGGEMVASKRFAVNARARIWCASYHWYIELNDPTTHHHSHKLHLLPVGVSGFYLEVDGCLFR